MSNFTVTIRFTNIFYYCKKWKNVQGYNGGEDTSVGLERFLVINWTCENELWIAELSLQELNENVEVQRPFTAFLLESNEPQVFLGKKELSFPYKQHYFSSCSGLTLPKH